MSCGANVEESMKQNSFMSGSQSLEVNPQLNEEATFSTLFSERLKVSSFSNGINPQRYIRNGCPPRLRLSSVEDTTSNYNVKLDSCNRTRSRSVVTSPSDLLASSTLSPKSTTSSVSFGSKFSGYNSNSSKLNGRPKRWFSISNLLNKQNLENLFEISKSKLNVSTVDVNAVFSTQASGAKRSQDCSHASGRCRADSTSSYFSNSHVFSKPCEEGSVRYRTDGKFSTNPYTQANAPNLLKEDLTYNMSSSGSSPKVVYRKKRSSSSSGKFPPNEFIIPNLASNTAHPYDTAHTNQYNNDEVIENHKRYSGETNHSGSCSGRSSGIGMCLTSNSNSSCTPRASRLSYGEFSSENPSSPTHSSETTAEKDRQDNFIAGRMGPSNSYDVVGFYNLDPSEFQQFELGRSLPTLLETMESSHSCNGDALCSSLPAIRIEDVMELILNEYAVLTGSKSKDDHYIIMLPDRGNFHLLSNEDYKRLMIYLTSIPQLQDAESGFCIIIDRRNDRWNSVKSTLLRISTFFPGLIHRVFVLRPTNFIQKAIAEVCSKLLRIDNLRFRITICNHMDDLNSFIEPNQLTTDLGGTLPYDKGMWIQQRVEVEAFNLALQSLSKDLKAFTESFHYLEYPNDVKSTENLISFKEGRVNKLLSELKEAGEHGEKLLARIKLSDDLNNINTPLTSNENAEGSLANNNVRKENQEQSSSFRSNPLGSPATHDQDKFNENSSFNFNEENNVTRWLMENKLNGGEKTPFMEEDKELTNMKRDGVSLNNSFQLINVISVERYIIQVEETAKLFNEFWLKEKAALDQCLKLRMFEQEFKELQISFSHHTKLLNELPDMGESLSTTEQLIMETTSLKSNAQDDLQRACQLEQIGHDIISSNGSAVDSIEPKCLELSRIVSSFHTILGEKLSKQKEWCEIQFKIEQANRLCTEGMELMTCTSSTSSGLSDDCLDTRNLMISEVDGFVEKLNVLVKELSDLKECSDLANDLQRKTLIKQVQKRINDVQLMCAKKRSALVQQIMRTKNGPHSSHLATSTNNSHGAHELKSAKSTSQLDFIIGEDSSTPSLRSGSSSLSLDGNSNGFKVSMNGSIGSSDSGPQSTEDSMETKRIRRGHILRELLQTEGTYVKEIGDVLTIYKKEALKAENHRLLPKQLADSGNTKPQSGDGWKRTSINILFCNLDEIYTFHSQMFLPDLENCAQSIELVALCFIQRHCDFLAMYSQYCQLLPASERLRKDIGENHPWFISCRQRLGHKLPLGAYLLKPVQRITKYHLLLKDLVKFSEGCEGFLEMTEALEHMLVVLRCVNDGMHQLAITGFPGRLIDEGYLILQAPFLLWNESAKDRLRLKGHPRHLFLYQKSILICKKDQKSSGYEFRNKLNLSDVGLTETLKGSAASRKFEIWVNARQKVYVLQAETGDVKDLWVREIKKLLLQQLESLKATKSRSLGGFANGGNIITAGIVSSAASKRQKMMMMHKGVSFNGFKIGHSDAKSLRQMSSWDKNEGHGRLTKSNDLEECWSSEAEGSNSEDEEYIGQFISQSVGAKARALRSNSGSKELEKPPESSSSSFEIGSKFISLADYNAMSAGEVSLKEGDVVKVLKEGCGGWWFVKIVGSNGGPLIGPEGWAPSAYLDCNSSNSSKRASLTLPNCISVEPDPNPNKPLSQQNSCSSVGS